LHRGARHVEVPAQTSDQRARSALSECWCPDHTCRREHNVHLCNKVGTRSDKVDASLLAQHTRRRSRDRFRSPAGDAPAELEPRVGSAPDPNCASDPSASLPFRPPSGRVGPRWTARRITDRVGVGPGRPQLGSALGRRRPAGAAFPQFGAPTGMTRAQLGEDRTPTGGSSHPSWGPVGSDRPQLGATGPQVEAVLGYTAPHLGPQALTPQLCEPSQLR
jgi:hypothetical protein